MVSEIWVASCTQRNAEDQGDYKRDNDLGCKMTFKIVISKTPRALIHAITLILTEKK